MEGSRVSLVPDRLRFDCTGEGLGEFGFLLGEADPLGRRGIAGMSRLGADRRGAEVDAAAAVLLVESAFDFERFRFNTFARMEVMLATSISGSSRSLDMSAANPARVLGPRITSGGETRSFSFSISRSASAINTRKYPAMPQKKVHSHSPCAISRRAHCSRLSKPPTSRTCTQCLRNQRRISTRVLSASCRTTESLGKNEAMRSVGWGRNRTEETTLYKCV
jgi:hypothetical protein